MAHNKVALSSIDVLTFHAGQKTIGRREASVPQLVCHGRLCSYAPRSAQCTNLSKDGETAQWRCEAHLPPGVRFGELEVVCEGWRNAGDSHVLAGSCGLEYELVKAGLGDQSIVEDGGRGWAATMMLCAMVLAGLYFGVIKLLMRVRRRRPGGSFSIRGGQLDVSSRKATPLKGSFKEQPLSPTPRSTRTISSTFWPSFASSIAGTDVYSRANSSSHTGTQEGDDKAASGEHRD